MTRDEYEFVNLKKYDGGSVKFAKEKVAPIYGIESISIYGKHKIDHVY